MSSGEVLFILAFIVLPTAVLVSSAWAILFVRRRPDRLMEHHADEQRWEDTATADDLRVVEDTAVLNSVSAAEERPTMTAADENYPPGDESDVNEDDFADHVHVTAPIAEPEPKSVPVPDEDEPETLAVVQTTDDLDAVVAEIRANETSKTLTEPEPTPEDEAELDSESESESETMIHDTTELPVLQSPSNKPDSEPTSNSAPIPEPVEETEALAGEEETGSRWKRRKRPAKLRPTDPDAARQRGRNRDPQRQVPQLGRSSRRRDDNTRDTPPDSLDPDEGDDTT